MYADKTIDLRLTVGDVNATVDNVDVYLAYEFTMSTAMNFSEANEDALEYSFIL